MHIFLIPVLQSNKKGISTLQILLYFLMCVFYHSSTLLILAFLFPISPFYQVIRTPPNYAVSILFPFPTYNKKVTTSIQFFNLFPNEKKKKEKWKRKRERQRNYVHVLCEWLKTRLWRQRIPPPFPASAPFPVNLGLSLCEGLKQVEKITIMILIFSWCRRRIRSGTQSCVRQTCH